MRIFRRFLLILLLFLLPCVAHGESTNPYPYAFPEQMPVIHINTAEEDREFIWRYFRSDKQAGNIEYVPAQISVVQCDEESRLDNVNAQVKVRGNYTLDYMKKSIRIKFDKAQNMLQLHNGKKYKNWVLLADWKDLSMLNNPVALYLGNAILEPDGYYCSDFCPVELYVNDTYWGVYLLVEQQEIKSGRTSLSETKKNQTSWENSYLLEYDHYAEEEMGLPEDKADPTFSITYYQYNGPAQPFTVKSDINHKRQLEFLESYIEKVYFIVYSALYEDKYYTFDPTYTKLILQQQSTPIETISKVIDIQSLVDTYVLYELVCNPDAYWSSFYIGLDMTVRGDKRLIFESPWDFDSSFGMRRSYELYDLPFEINFNNPWLALFRDVPWFQEMVREKWKELHEQKVPETALQLIRDYTARYEQNYLANYQRWDARIVHGNDEVVDELNIGKTQADAAEYMYNWLEGRIQWLDEQWLGIVPETEPEFDAEDDF